MWCYAAGIVTLVAAAEALGFPVVLKIVSPDLPHKTEVGGSALNLTSADAVRAAGVAMLARVRAAGGVITQPIFAYPGGRRFYFRDPCGNELGVWTECWDPIPAPRPILDRPAWPWRREARRRAREAGRLFSSPRP